MTADGKKPRLKRLTWLIRVSRFVNGEKRLLADIFDFSWIEDPVADEPCKQRTDVLEQRLKRFFISLLSAPQQLSAVLPPFLK
jgi:hypothetical protein